MTWHAECKRRNWYCILGWDAISWYSKFLYDEWLRSLTPAQIKKLKEYHKREKERKQKELENAFVDMIKLFDATGKFCQI